MDRLYLIIGSTRFECQPLGYGDSAIVSAKERDQVFYRDKFEGTLTFKGDDFTRLSEVELGNDQAQEIIFEIERNTLIYWRGYFTCSMCKWDFDRRVCEVTPNARDRYDIFMKNLDKSINITELGDELNPTNARIEVDSGYEVRWTWDVMFVVERLIESIRDDLVVTSSFFTDYDNPVTGTTNLLKNLTIAQKSDAKRPGASERAKKGDITFEVLMSIFRALFNVYWDVTTDGRFILEHLSYFDDIGTVIDLTQAKGEFGHRNYSYDTTTIPRAEIVTVQGYHPDFTEVKIDYDSNQAQGDPIETKFDLCFDTDCLLLADDGATEITDSGFFLFTSDGDGMYRTILTSETGDGVMAKNGALAFSTLVRDYWGWGRPLKNGKVGSKELSFVTSKRRIVQNLPIVDCFDINTWDSYETSLSGIIKYKAKVREKKKYVNGNLDLVLEYGDLNEGQHD